MRPATLGQRIVRGIAIAAAAVALVAPAPVRAAGDFTLLISPSSQLLPPGGSVAFVVEVGSVGGFADPVGLAVGALPDGVTFILSSATVTPPAQVTLTLIATAEAATGEVDLEVTGTSGALSHTTTGSVTVNFGLVPVCDGFMQGTVTDQVTHAPIEGASVNALPTDAAGHWGPVPVTLGINNSPVASFILVRKDGYWNRLVFGEDVFCGQTTTVDATLLKFLPATIDGTVVLGMPDPADPDLSIADPAGGPLVDAVVTSIGLPSSDNVSDISDELGAFELTLPHVGQDNTALQMGVTGFLDGYWPPNRTGYVDAGEMQPGETSSVVVPLVPKCQGSISGSVVLSDTLAPAVGVTVQANFVQTITNAAGEFSFPSLDLDHNNQPADYSVFTSMLDYDSDSENTTLTGCGDHRVVELALDPLAFGALEGFVRDEETGEPIEGANAGPWFCGVCNYDEQTTDATGHYRVTHIPADVPSEWLVKATHPSYWEASDTVTVNANETAGLDLVMLRVRHASVSGVVRDSVTLQPIEGAGVSGPSTAVTGATGAYEVTGLPLGDRNSDGATSITAGAFGYWPQSTVIEYSADEAVTQDFELLKVCAGATIRGGVVDFVTGLPIEGAEVFVIGGGGAFTDEHGSYVIENVPVGTNNSPNAVTVNVSADGYFPQSREVTVFCGAHFELDFAPPPPTSALEGTVTNAVTGDPIPDVTMIGEWGDQTTTDVDGYYAFIKVPLQADGSDRVWDVSALTDDCGQSTESFTATANVTARVDFAFCEPTGGDRPAITLEKAGTFAPGSNSLADPGESIAYTLTVRNTGDVDVHGVSVTDAKLGTVACPASTIAVGGSLTCTGSYSVTQIDIDAGTVANTATADSNETDPVTTSTTTNLPVSATLQLGKQADTSSFDRIGIKISYTYTLTNTGNATLAGPFTVADDQAGDESCPVLPATLAPGGSITCTASDTTSQQDLDRGSITNTATAHATRGSSAIASNEATVTVPAVQRPELALVKTASPTTYAAAGEVIAYAFTATNAGNVTVAAPYGVADDRSTNEHCPATPATLAPGASVTCSATYTITAADVSAGSVTNRATVTAALGTRVVTSNVATATATRTALLGGQILPTQTTCQQYRSGAASLTEAAYNPQKEKIGSVAPGVMFFYDTFSVGAGSAPVTISVTQSRAPSIAGWTTIPVQDTGQIVLYDRATCLKSRAAGPTTYQASTGTATVRVLVPGSFILGIKYNLSSLAGIPVGKSPPTVVYTFGRVNGGTTASITVRPKK